MRPRSPLLFGSIGLAALLVAVFLIWPDDPPDDPMEVRVALDGGPVEAAVGLEPDPVERESVDHERPPLSNGPPGRPFVPSAGEVTLIGRVVDDQGQPRAEATVAVHVGRHKLLMDREALASGQTNADGSYRLAGLEPGESYLVRAALEGYLDAFSPPVDPAAAATIELGDLVLMRLCKVTGKVADPAGHPIPEVIVRHSRDRDESGAVTDAGGRFSLNGVPPGRLTIHAEAPGFVAVRGPTPDSFSNQFQLQLRPGEQRDDLLLVLEAEGIIRGRIVGPDGAPMFAEPFRIRARASTGASTGNASVTVSEGGAFTLRRLHPDETYDVIAEGLSGRTATRAGVHCGDPELSFVFERLPAVLVTVRSEVDGAPLRPDQVWLMKGREVVRDLRAHLWLPDPMEDPAPILFLPYREAGTHELSVLLKGFAKFQSGPLVLDGRSDYGPITALLRERPPAEEEVTTGIVRLAATREPLPGVRVRLAGQYLGNRRYLARLHGVLVSGVSHVSGVPTVRTGPDGRFSFPNEFTPTSIELNDARYCASRLDLPRGSSLQDLEILAYQPGAVEGRVLLVSGEFGAGLPVVAHRADAEPRTTRTDERGEYRIGALLPGLWNISAGNPYARAETGAGGRLKPGQAFPADRSPTVQVDVPEGRFATANIDLRALGAALEGTVTMNGRPWASTGVTLLPLNGLPSDPLMNQLASTGAAGDYGFPGLPPGRYRAIVRGDRGRGVLAEAALTLPRGHVVRHDFDIRLGQLRVTVAKQENGEPLPSSSVTVERVPEPGETPAAGAVSKTDADGLAVVEDLPADAFFVLIRTTRGSLGRRVDLEPGETRNLMVLVPPPATLQITLDASGLQDVQSIVIEFFSDGHRVQVHRIWDPPDHPGVTLSDLQPGDYELRVKSYPTGWAATGQVRVLPGASNAIALTLEAVGKAEADH